MRVNVNIYIYKHMYEHISISEMQVYKHTNSNVYQIWANNVNLLT